MLNQSLRRIGRVAIAAAAIAFGVGGAAEAGGLLHELKAGVLAHDVPDLWSGFRAEPNAAAINIEAILSPSMPFLGGTVRPAIGASINTRGDTSHAYIDARWEYETPFGLYFALGLGGAVHDGADGPEGGRDRKWLGSSILFHIPAEIGYRLDSHNSLSVYFEHVSNAYTQDYNEGMDRLGVRYGYRF